MKKNLFAFIALLAVTLTACNNNNDKNLFQDTGWTSTTYITGYTAVITFSDLTCSLTITEDLSGFQQGANYTYTHSDKTASLTPIGENAVSHRAVISGASLTLTNLVSGTVITFTKN